MVAREIDDVHPELPSMLEEELEEPIRLEMLGDGHDRGDPEPHRPAADVPVARVRERDHHTLPVRQALLDVLDPLEPERVRHPLVAPPEHVERVEPVPAVEGERLAGGRLHEWVVHRPAQHLRLVGGDGGTRPGRQPEEEASRPTRTPTGRSSSAGSGRASS